jgi:pyruvate/2-oxoglutarate dehydrogenase complex dihydrolipoamide dehydrogenase (E3) component
MGQWDTRLDSSTDYFIVEFISTIDSYSLHFSGVKAKRDAYIGRLNGIYVKNLDKSNVEIIEGAGSFVGNSFIF